MTASTADTLQHLGMFGTCWLVGFAHHDGALSRRGRGRTVLLGLALMALGMVWALTHQLPESGWDIDEIPVADALYGLGAVLVLLRLYPRRPVLAAVPWLARLVGAMNARAMTIYLWGNAAIAAATPIIESNRWTRDLSASTWQGKVAQYAVAWLVLGAIVLAAGWAEDVAAGRAPRLNPWPRRVPLPPGPVRPAASTAALGVLAAGLTGVLVVGVLGPAGRATAPRVNDGDGPLPGTTAARTYPMHTSVPASVFRIGAQVPGQGDDEQSLRSGWDRDWAAHFGGCDGYGSRVPAAAPTSPDAPRRTGFPSRWSPRRTRSTWACRTTTSTTSPAAPRFRGPATRPTREHLADPVVLAGQEPLGAGDRAPRAAATGRSRTPGPAARTRATSWGQRDRRHARDQPQSCARPVRRHDGRRRRSPGRLGVRGPAAGRSWTAVPTSRQADQNGRRP